MNLACPSCHQANPGDATFCGQCGTALKTESSCTACGRTNSADLTFCRSCGARLGVSPTSALTGARPALDRLAQDVFVGRERELDVLRVSLEEALTGRGRAVVLLGEPGIGKTRLATELASSAQAQDMRVLIGRCPDSDGAPPYWSWAQIVRADII